MRVQRRIRNHRICTELLRNLIPKCRNLRIGRRCRGRWLSSNRNSSRNVVRRVGGKTQSAEPRPCRGQIFPAGGDDRPFLGWFWCSPPLRWTTKGHGSLPMPANKVALGRHRQRQQPEHALQPTKLLKAVCFLDALTLSLFCSYSGDAERSVRPHSACLGRRVQKHERTQDPCQPGCFG